MSNMMGNRMLFSILKEVSNHNRKLNGRLYSIKEFEFVQLIRRIMEMGFIRGAIVINDQDRVLFGGAKITNVGKEFLKEHQYLNHTYPSNDKIGDWIKEEFGEFNDQTSLTSNSMAVLTDIDFEIIKDRIYTIAYRIEQLGGQVMELEIGKPANKAEVEKIEKQLGHPLPRCFKKVLLEFTTDFHFQWTLATNPPDIESDPFKQIFSGSLHWNLFDLIQVEEGRQDWLEIFYDTDDLKQEIWHNKLAFCEVGNGDLLSIALNDQKFSPIVYLDHELGESHGYYMAQNFLELLENWSRVAFVGSEEYQWSIFTENSTSGINPEGDTAKKFREWLKLDI